LANSSEGDSSTWPLDPEERTADGEWAAGSRASWNPAMVRGASSFAELMKQEHESFLSLHDPPVQDEGSQEATGSESPGAMPAGRPS
jgi:hypothetical protein